MSSTEGVTITLSLLDILQHRGIGLYLMGSAVGGGLAGRISIKTWMPSLIANNVVQQNDQRRTSRSLRSLLQHLSRRIFLNLLSSYLLVQKQYLTYHLSGYRKLCKPALALWHQSVAKLFDLKNSPVLGHPVYTGSWHDGEYCWAVLELSFVLHHFWLF